MPIDDLTALGQKMREARKKKDLTQQELADLSHVSVKQIANIEKLIVRLPCGSPSIRSTFFPACARPIPKFAQVVVLPTPPFWLAMAMICVFK